MDNQTNQPAQGGSKASMWVIIVVVVIIVAGGAYYFLANDENTNNVNTTNTTVNTAANSNENTNAVVNENVNKNINVAANENVNTETNTNTIVDTSGWETYENNTLNFSFNYPSDWTLSESLPGGNTYGEVVSIQSPETAEKLANGTIDPGYSDDMTISYWSSINNEYARGGSWVGQREYTDLLDYFSDENAPKKRVGEITVDGKTAYEVSIGGAGLAYGVMIENNGIYEMAFPTAWDKSKLTSVQEAILNSFAFTE